MRYIGNKNRLLDEIELFIEETITDASTFCDLFGGTGSVANHFKNRYTITANDYMKYSYVYLYAFLNTKETPTFSSLGFDPFAFINDESNKGEAGFITKNYSPYRTNERMYFSVENAKKIDCFRSSIETWYRENKITEIEYYYLIASLVESLSKRSNVAGVYGAYLKKWDSRATKPLIVTPLEISEFSKYNNYAYNDDSMNLLDKLEGDILYLDPPYTKNDYATQYHILETVVKYDEPEIKGISGLRQDRFKSTFNNKFKAYVDFEKIIAEANFEHIIISYSNKGLVEIEFFELLAKKYGIDYKLKEVGYRNYTNKKSIENNSNVEYLIYIQKDLEKKIYIESPLNYMGSKFKILDQIFEFAGEDYDTFIDLFGGGFNVGVNATGTIVFNELNHYLKDLVELFATGDIAMILQKIDKTIKRNKLTKKGKEEFIAFRKKYNSKSIKNRDVLDLYVLLMYGFQQQFRFNNKHEFNNTCGMSNYNLNTVLKLVSFSRVCKKKNLVFFSEDYVDLELEVNENTLFYCDPPYYVTLGSYNDGKRGFKGWGEKEEKELYRYLSEIDSKGGKFVLSNVFEHKGNVNKILLDWMNQNDFNVEHLEIRKRKEVLIKNF